MTAKHKIKHEIDYMYLVTPNYSFDERVAMGNDEHWISIPAENSRLTYNMCVLCSH